MKSFKSLRDPWMIGEYRLFGDILPFIGFETVEASATDISKQYDVEVEPGHYVLYGNFFTLEWLGKGVSVGGFRVPVSGD